MRPGTASRTASYSDAVFKAGHYNKAGKEAQILVASPRTASIMIVIKKQDLNALFRAMEELFP
jgi:hypothetical protein